jgi:arabinan endo-1,5-alpha-L-arabinosidase
MCCRGVRSTYNVRVGRSSKVTGPYLDRSGKPMTEGGGTLILEGAGRVRGPGHNSILTEGARQYIVHHFYDADDNGRSKLQIRPLTWSRDGWPVVGEPLAPAK